MPLNLKLAFIRGSETPKIITRHKTFSSNMIVGFVVAVRVYNNSISLFIAFVK